MEKLRNISKNRIAQGALVVGLGLFALSGCGENTLPASGTTDAEPTVTYDYYDNGTRAIRYQNEDDQYANVYQVCDGNDLVEQTEFWKFGHGAAGNSLERSVDHPACDDGRLTPEDFRVAG